MDVKTLSLPILATFGLYALVMIAIGFYFWRRTKVPEDFFLGNRSMGPTVSALSAGASDMSSWLLMGLPGALYITGVFDAWIAIGLSIGATLNWIFVAKRLRIYTEVLSNSITIPDYFESRFADEKHILRLVSAIVILVFFVFYISSGLIAGAKLFEQTFHINYAYALIIGAGVIVCYTFFGGYLAVCWTDLLQGILMMLALIVVPIVMVKNIGGIEDSIKYIEQSDKIETAIVTHLKSQIDTQQIDFIITNINNAKGQEKLQLLNETLKNALKVHNLKGINKFYDDLQTWEKDNNFIVALDSKNNIESSIVKNANNESVKNKENAMQDLQNIDSKKLETILLALGKFMDGKHKVDHFSFLNGITLIGLASTIAWGLGYFGQPHIIVRFMSIRSTKDIPKATTIGIGWMVISLIGACLVGLLGVAYSIKYNIEFADAEKIFIIMSQTLFNPWITGILLSALLAAIMSTASSQLLVSASTVAEDFYRKIIKKDATPSQVMFLSRTSVLVVSFVAFFLSIKDNETILSIVAYAWAGFGASFGSVILFSLFWRRMTRAGAISGMIVGAIAVIVHKNFTYQYFEIYEIVPGFVLASLAIIIVSLMQPVREGTLVAFDKMLDEIKKGKI